MLTSSQLKSGDFLAKENGLCASKCFKEIIIAFMLIKLAKIVITLFPVLLEKTDLVKDMNLVSLYKLLHRFIKMEEKK